MASSQFSDSSVAAGPLPHQLLLVGHPDEDRSQLRRDLIAHGFHVTLATDGGQAHSAFAMHKPDLVLLDILLPEESGFEVCERMKRTEPSIPVIIVTEVDLPEARSLAERVGADDYLISPCDLEYLIERIAIVNQKVWEQNHIQQPKESGRVRFQCRCGKRLKVSSAHRGKSMSCPRCGEPLVVPRHD